MRAFNDVVAICGEASNTDMAQEQGFRDAVGCLSLQSEQETLHAEHKAANALNEMRKSLNQADLLHSCMLSLSSADELVSRCHEAEQVLNSALLDEQDCKGTAESLRERFEAELEAICARLAPSGASAVAPMVACFDELCAQSNEAREHLLCASMRVRERRAALQKLQIQQHACQHMEQLISVAHKHGHACKLEAKPGSCDRVQPQLQRIDEHVALTDSRESTLTVAGGIPHMRNESIEDVDCDCSEACSSSRQTENRRLNTNANSKKPKKRGEVRYSGLNYSFKHVFLFCSEQEGAH